MHEFNCVDKWDHKIEAWLQLSVEFPKTVKHHSVLLGYNQDETKQVTFYLSDSLRDMLLARVKGVC